MKVMTILGTRPEIIRLSLIIKKLDKYADNHVLVHTGQNFTSTLSDVFFQQLSLRKPDYILNHTKQSLGNQLSLMFSKLEKIFLKEKPDKLLVLGDTNSGLSTILAERMGIKVFHMEAGNRCFDWNVPEEVNRKLIDSIASINLPYTPNSKENLMREGVSNERIYVTGNPIFEVLTHYSQEINSSDILNKLNLEKEKYMLVTIHRTENVDHEQNLVNIINGLSDVANYYNQRMICSLHPRTASKLNDAILKNRSPLLEFNEPFGFFDFITLEKNASLVLTDSGTVQEECCIFQVPTVTVRTTTERPETIECGSNMLAGVNRTLISKAAQIMFEQDRKWACPEGYKDLQVSKKVLNLLMGGTGNV